MPKFTIYLSNEQQRELEKVKLKYKDQWDMDLSNSGIIQKCIRNTFKLLKLDD